MTWKQGFDWKYIPPPYDQPEPISLGETPPIGAKYTGGRTPGETLQIIGQAGASVPSRIAIDLGVVDILIRDGQEIQFESGGLDTDVGESLGSPTEGMSIGGVDMERRYVPPEVEVRPVVAESAGDDHSDLFEVTEEDVIGDENGDLSDLTDVDPEQDIIGGDIEDLVSLDDRGNAIGAPRERPTAYRVSRRGRRIVRRPFPPDMGGMRY